MLYSAQPIHATSIGTFTQCKDEMRLENARSIPAQALYNKEHLTVRMPSMEKLCPRDGSVLESKHKQWHCPSCQTDYRVRGMCADCGAELERIAACGASNWFCNHCNELKSKSRVTTELVVVDHD